jgi:hypothetical protein
MDAIITSFDPLKGYARLRPVTFASEAKSSDTPDETEPDEVAEQEAEPVAEEVLDEATEEQEVPVENDVPEELVEEQEEPVEEPVVEYFFHVSQLQSHTFPGITVGTRVTFEPLEPDSNLVRWVKIHD